MNDLLLVTPQNVTLSDIARVLASRWTVTGSVTQPRVELDPNSKAYLEELGTDAALDEEIFLDEPLAREVMRALLGDFRVITMRYSDPVLARELALTIARAPLAGEGLFLNSDGKFRSADDYLRELS